MTEELPYRKCVSIFLRKGDKFFAGERSDTPNAWQPPQGGVDKNEEIIETAKRELREETGITSVKFVKKTETSFRYNFTDEAQKDCIKKYGSVKYAGQEVIFTLFDFIGDESEINLQTTSPAEFSRQKWMNADELIYSMVDFKKDAFIKGAKLLEII